ENQGVTAKVPARYHVQDPDGTHPEGQNHRNPNRNCTMAIPALAKVIRTSIRFSKNKGRKKPREEPAHSQLLSPRGGTYPSQAGKKSRPGEHLESTEK